MSPDRFLTALLDRVRSRSDSAFCHSYGHEGQLRTVTFAELEGELAERTAQIGDELPVGALLFILDDDPLEQVMWWLAGLVTGVVPGILTPPTAKLDLERYAHQLETTLAAYPTARLIVSREVAGRLPDGVLPPARLLARAEGRTAGELLLRVRPPDSPLLFQQSSGTTGLRKGVLLSEAAVVAQLAAYAEAITVQPDDVIVSWLPLYHDMGLIACLAQAVHRCIPLVLTSPFTWLGRPGWLFEAAAAHGGTLTWLPNFAFNLMADRVPADDFAPDALSSFRLVVSCSEPVQPESVERFNAAFQRIGLRPDALASSYAMAEAVFAVTQSPPGAGIVVERVDPALLRDGRAARTVDGKPIASSGIPIPGTEIRIEAADGGEIGVGEIFVRSNSLMSGYFGVGAGDNPIEDDWLKTGDIGFQLDGELFVIGRSKDLIIRAGRNYDPLEIEALAEAVDGVKPGRVAAFGLTSEAEGTEEIVVLGEFEGTIERDSPMIVREIFEQLARSGVLAQRVEIVRPGWLAKSSSGKISRAACREKYAAMLERRRAPRLFETNYAENLPEELQDAFAAFGAETKVRTPTEVSAPGRIALGNWVALGRHGKLLLQTDFSIAERYARQHYGDVEHEYDPAIYGLRDPSLVIDDGASIGDDFFISCARSIRIGKHALISARVFVSDSNHLVDNPDLPISMQSNSMGTPLEIDDHCWIGVNCCILEGARIGRHAVVSAGSVVTSDVPPFAVVAGNPARIVRMLADSPPATDEPSAPPSSAEGANLADTIVAAVLKFIGRKRPGVRLDDPLLGAQGLLDSLEVLELLSYLDAHLDTTIDERSLWEQDPKTVRELGAAIAGVVQSG